MMNGESRRERALQDSEPGKRVRLKRRKKKRSSNEREGKKERYILGRVVCLPVCVIYSVLSCSREKSREREKKKKESKTVRRAFNFFDGCTRRKEEEKNLRD